MRRVFGVISLAFLLLAAPAARSTVQDPAAAFVSQMAADAHVTELSGLVVTATRPKSTALSGLDVAYPVKCLEPRKPTDKTVPAPRLLSTYPAGGETVEPGYVVLRLTFDLPMACRGLGGARPPGRLRVGGGSRGGGGAGAGIRGQDPAAEDPGLAPEP
jgi:hypothetical protein